VALERKPAESVTIESSWGVRMVIVICKSGERLMNFGGPCRIRTYNQRIMRTIVLA
jgi:hypothetical protein